MDWIELAITAPPNKHMVWFDVPKKKPLLSKQDIVGGKSGYWKFAFGEGVMCEPSRAEPSRAGCRNRLLKPA
jgi:hypothetical protein